LVVVSSSDELDCALLAALLGIVGHPVTVFRHVAVASVFSPRVLAPAGRFCRGPIAKNRLASLVREILYDTLALESGPSGRPAAPFVGLCDYSVARWSGN